MKNASPGLSQLLRQSRTYYCIFLLLLALVLASCGVPGIVSTNAQLPAVNTTPQKVTWPPIRFPQDEAAHRDLTEWWYYTGHMNAVTPEGAPHHYGFELVIFQALRSDLPPVYAAHFAISDITRSQFHFDQRRLVEPAALIPDGTSTAGINVAVGDWTIQGVNGLDHLTAQMADYAIQLTLRALKPPALHNGNGLISFGPGGFSYYYSRTRMALSGTLIDHNQPLQVTGEAWMDHQWGNFFSAGGGGWDWFSLQLNNGTEMMLHFIRDGIGKIAAVYVGYIGLDAVEHLLPATAIHVNILDHWTSRLTGATYPSGWRIQIKDPLLQASLTLTPELLNQELTAYQSTGNAYWEGAVTIHGQSAGAAVQGEGYVELTGYAR